MGRWRPWNGYVRKSRWSWVGASTATAARGWPRPRCAAAASSTRPSADWIAVNAITKALGGLDMLKDLEGAGGLGEGWDLGEASRRDFLKLMGFSLGAAALASCTPIPERQAVPPLTLADRGAAARRRDLVRHHLRRLRRGVRPAGQDPRRPADQDRGKSVLPSLRRRHLRRGAGLGALAV